MTRSRTGGSGPLRLWRLFAVAVIRVVGVATATIGLDPVDDNAEDRAADIAHVSRGALELVPQRLRRLDDENHAVRVFRQHYAVGDDLKRRRIEDDAVKTLRKLFD